MLSEIIQLIGLVLDFVGAILLAIPFIRSSKEIEEESSTYWGYSPPLRRAMKRENRLTKAGLIFLSIGFLLQILSIMVWIFS